MHKIQKSLAASLLAAAMVLPLAACGANALVPSPSPDTASGNVHTARWSEMKYTQADYDLAMSFKTEGYAQTSVAAFNRMVMDWDDEEAYHKTEEAFQRLSATLPEDDPNADFIFGTLENTWDECRKKHYNTCEREQQPWHSGWVSCETYGDVFGDRVLLCGGYTGFDFNYTIQDEQTLTVGERDSILQGIGAGLESYMSGQGQEKLRDEKKMEKALEAELERLLKAMDKKITWGGDSSADYSWTQMYGYGNYNETVADNGWGGEDAYRYTKAQYDLVISSLQFDGWEDMSVAEFNRRVNAAFSGDEWERDGLNYAYEMVRMSLDEKDANYAFLFNIIPTAQEEYDIRAEEVYCGTPLDFEKPLYVRTQQTEDVYGDEVVIAIGMADFTCKYRILDADKLTMREHEAFLNSIRQAAQDILRDAYPNALTESDFQDALAKAAKDLGGGNIQYTGCEINYLEAEPWY